MAFKPCQRIKELCTTYCDRATLLGQMCVCTTQTNKLGQITKSNFLMFIILLLTIYFIRWGSESKKPCISIYHWFIWLPRAVEEPGNEDHNNKINLFSKEDVMDVIVKNKLVTGAVS